MSSFYSKNLNGTLTSTGERFYNNKFTAACNLYKLNTIVRVTNLRNGKTVLVRINDRMHPNMLKKGRVIDLSQSAAKQLVFRSNGLVKVMVDAISFNASKTLSGQAEAKVSRSTLDLVRDLVDPKNRPQ